MQSQHLSITHILSSAHSSHGPSNTQIHVPKRIRFIDNVSMCQMLKQRPSKDQMGEAAAGWR